MSRERFELDGGHALEVTRDDETWPFCPWNVSLDLVNIGSGVTRDSAVQDAIDTLEKALAKLR